MAFIDSALVIMFPQSARRHDRLLLLYVWTRFRVAADAVVPFLVRLVGSQTE